MSNSYLDWIPKELLNLLCQFCSIEQMQAILQASDKLRSNYHQNDNNQLWSQRMSTRYSNSVVSLKEQVCKQDREDAISLKEYQRVYRNTKYYQDVTYMRTAYIDIIGNGFLSRYPAYRDQFLDLIKENLARYLDKSAESFIGPDGKDKLFVLYETSHYSTLGLGIILHDLEIISILLETAVRAPMNIYDRSSELITLILIQHQFHLLPLFENWYRAWVDNILSNIDDGKYRPRLHIFDQSIEAIHAPMIINMLIRCIDIIKTQYGDPHIPRFLMHFYGRFCIISGACTIDPITIEPIITFIYSQCSKYTNVIDLRFYYQRYLMQFDSLVKAMLSDNQFINVYNGLIENACYYSDDQIVQRLEFCYANNPCILNESHVNIAYYNTVTHNNLSAIQFLFKYYPRSIIQPITNNRILLSFEMLEYLTSSNIKMSYSIKCRITYIVDTAEDISRYLRLFAFLGTNRAFDPENQLISGPSMTDFLISAVGIPQCHELMPTILRVIETSFPDLMSEGIFKDAYDHMNAACHESD
jgi:hypothetical protein